MCNYFSCVVTKAGKVFWSKRTVSHETVIKDNNLDDTKGVDRIICRVEIVPDAKDYTQPTSKWKLKIDEEEKPEWFSIKHERACFDAFNKSIKEQLFTKGKHEVSDMFCIASGNSTVTVYDNSTVEAFDNSTVTAFDNSTVTAFDNSTVTAFDNSTVEARGNLTVTARDNSTVTAFDNSTVEAYDNSTVEAVDNSTVKAFDNSTVEARDNSTVTAYGNSTVHLYSGEAKAELNSDMAVINDHDNDVIIVSKKAKVKKV